VHRDTCEPGEGAVVVDTLFTAFGVAGDQGELLGARGVPQVQPALRTKAGLVEPATGVRVICSRTASVNSSRPSATRRAIAATAPSEIGVPSNSASA
jgi:hypothetical protein